MSDHQASSGIDFKALFDTAPDAIVVHDFEYRVIFWNRAAEILYGWNSAEILGRPISRILYLDAHQREEAIKTLRNGGRWCQELRQIDRKGTEHLVKVRQQMQRATDGRPMAIVSFNTKIDEGLQSEDAQARAHAVRSSNILAGGIAHELNNALAPIMLSSAMLRRSVEGGRARNLADMIEKSARKGTELIGHLLEFERGKGGGSDYIRAAQIELGIEEASREHLPDNVVMHIEVEEDLWECRGEFSDWLQAFKNVIQNACEAMPNGGQLIVEARNQIIEEKSDLHDAEDRVGAYVCIAFKDTGVGIGREWLPHVAEPFYTTKNPKQGFGFGLSSTQAMIKGHRGFMAIESERGVGTTLSLFLPAKPNVSPREKKESGPCERESCGGGQILIADDDSCVRETIREVLEDRGYHVFSAQDGTEALATYANRLKEIDLVVTNVEMPSMDGSALCRALKELDPEVKILVTCGNMQSDRIQTIRSFGVEEFLAKPYTEDTLADRIGSLLGR